MSEKAEVVICGAGIAGISAAYHLAVRHGVKDILLVDERPPLSLTSDKSTECYRNWWPGPGDSMVALMNRSIDLLEELAEESGDRFHLNRRGYLFVTGNRSKIPAILSAAEKTSRLGAGPLRVHQGRQTDPEYMPSNPDGHTKALTGADLFLDPGLIQKHFPYLAEQSAAALHVRRAGWFSSQQLGMLLLERAVSHGVQLVSARIRSVDVQSGRVQAVRLGNGERVETRCFINAAGPFLKEVGGMLGVDLPVYCEPHLKIAFTDALGVVPRSAPLLIWSDAQTLPWTDEERQLLAEDEDTQGLFGLFPPYVHTRPEGGPGSQTLLMLWEYGSQFVEPVWPIPLDPQYPEVVLRGLSTMIPGLKAYFNRSTRPFLDGGYYTKTLENRPLIGPLPVRGVYLSGALSGFGLMSSAAAGELLAAHVTGSSLPPYAPAFMLERYQDPAYQAQLAAWEDSGQL
jgi:glycine/D-amino acid oxidase-like deaminating enzyme